MGKAALPPAWQSSTSKAGVDFQQVAFNTELFWELCSLWLFKEYLIPIVMYKAMSNHTVVGWGGKKFQLRGGTQNQGVRQRGMLLDSDSDQDIIQKVLEAPLVWHEY